ncbi:hypothetical protein P261_00624 [Lachnospiraceae bacterium TWA4]|nr:hypothetical protein P261_00624 [Lachnospiraceae bacterium TWA4]
MKMFNTTVVCIPERHYMVDISSKINQIIERYINYNRYFVINRARQYGKTTTLYMLERTLASKYYVLSIGFAGKPSLFASEKAFVQGFIEKLKMAMKFAKVPANLINEFKVDEDSINPLQDLDNQITKFCMSSDREVILMIDEIDEATNNDIVIYFLAMLRDKYINWSVGKDCTFKNVILAGVYDVKNLKRRIRPDEEHRYNSPWNVAVNFDIDLSFSVSDIERMISEYKSDYGLDFDVHWFSEQIYAYTSGYPFLVSRICELLDTSVTFNKEFGSRSVAWTKEGFLQAIRELLSERNTLFDDLVKKLDENTGLKNLIYAIIVEGKTVPFNQMDNLIEMGLMFGWFKEKIIIQFFRIVFSKL